MLCEAPMSLVWRRYTWKRAKGWETILAAAIRVQHKLANSNHARNVKALRDDLF